MIFSQTQSIRPPLARLAGKLLALLALLQIASVFPSVAVAQVRPSGGMIRYPDVSRDQIVFVYADDLWVVDRQGGVAMPLASPAGAERNPRFSPDGQSIAFIGNYDGGTDLYTIPVTGGIAQRMTFHPANETLCDWMPDGKTLLYSTNGFAGLSRQLQLFTISQEHPLPKQLSVPYGSNGSVSDDGRMLAYTPHSRDTRTWKRYRGGMASDIWLYDLQSKSSRQITDFEGTDSIPMWFGKTVYYLSDGGAEHRLNIWAFNTSTGERRQVTKFSDFDCKWPAMGPGPNGKGEIVFQNGSDIHLLNLATNKTKTVKIAVPGDRPRLRNQKIDASEFIRGAGVSPNAKRMVVEARGDIWTVPAKNGPPRNLTRSDGVAERSPAWSPDGRWIAYFSDHTGEYQLYVTQSDGRGETRQLTKDNVRYLYSITWSPDSKHLTWTDNSGKLYAYDLAAGKSRQVDVDPTAQRLVPSWSHDSNWLAYAKNQNNRSGNSAVWVFNVSNGEKRQLTSGFFSDSNPVFDRKGEYLYFSSNRAINTPRYDELGTTFIYTKTEILMAMPLRNDLPHPMLPSTDEESWEDEKPAGKEGAEKKSDKAAGEDAKNGEANNNGKAKKSVEDNKDAGAKATTEISDTEDEPIQIEFEGIEARSFQLPVEQGSFGTLAVNDKNQLIYGERPARGASGTSAIKLFDLHGDSKKPATVVEGVSSFDITADGKKLMVAKSGSYYFVSAAAGQKLTKPVQTSGMQTLIDPRVEWRQMFVEAWRIEREFFYDPTMHGVDWDKIRQHYEPMVDDCVSRRDLGFLIGEMIAELNVGHAYYRSGSVERGPRSNVGLLGCRFEIDEEHYRIGQLFEGAAWDVDARNPLKMAGVDRGDYLLAINDVPVSSQENIYSAFQDLANRPVILTISKDNKMDDDDRRVTLKTMSSDSTLRFRNWIENNRRIVEKKTDGKVGYIYVVNTGVPGQNDLVRQLFGQLNKEALIIDDRWNGGGQIPTRFIELLNRPVTNYWARRHGTDWTWPPDAHHGPKCMLINGMAGSGGDMFPALFKQVGLGKLIGTRTWGGLVGITGGPSLLDGASVTAPSFAYYEKDGTWGIEGHGVDPDIEVIDDPAKMQKQNDPQLNVAIRQMLKELKTNPYQPPQRPAYPDRSRFGIAPEDK